MNNFSCPICGHHDKENFLKVWDHQREQQFEIVGCSKCRLVSLNELPSSELLNKYYVDSYHYKIKEKGILHFLENNLNLAMHRRHLKHIEKRIRTKVRQYSDKSNPLEKKLLDLGCGSGYFLKFAQQKGWKVQGVEMSSYAAEIARNQGLNISTGSIAEVNFPDETFTVITMFNVLEHMVDLNGVMEKVYRWLKPDGLLVIEVPNVESLQRKMFKGNWVHWDVPRHIFHFSPKTIRNLMQKHNLKMIREYSLPFSSHEVAGWLHSLTFSLRGKKKSENLADSENISKVQGFSSPTLLHQLKSLVAVSVGQLARLIPERVYFKPGIKTYLFQKNLVKVKI